MTIQRTSSIRRRQNQTTDMSVVSQPLSAEVMNQSAQDLRSYVNEYSVLSEQRMYKARDIGDWLTSLKQQCGHGNYLDIVRASGLEQQRADEFVKVYECWEELQRYQLLEHSPSYAIKQLSVKRRESQQQQTPDPSDQPSQPQPRRRALDVALHTFNSLHHTTLTPDQLDNRETILSLPPQTAAELYRYLVYTCNQHPNKLPQPIQDAFLASGASFKPVTQQVRTTEASGQEVRRIERFVEIEVPPEANAETRITPSDPTDESASQPSEANGLRDRMPNDEGADEIHKKQAVTQSQQGVEGADEIDALYKLIEQLQADITQLNERNEQLEIELAKQATTPQPTAPQPTPSSFNALDGAQELEQDDQLTKLKKDNQSLTQELQKMAESNQQLREQLQTLQSNQPQPQLSPQEERLVSQGFKTTAHLKDLQYIEKLERTLEARDARLAHFESLLEGGVQKHKENALQLQPRQWAQMQAFPPVLPSQMYTTNLPPVPQEVQDMGLQRYYYQSAQVIGSLLSETISMSALLAEHNLTVPDQLTAAVSAEIKKTLLPTIA